MTDEQKLVVETIRQEMSYRREKQWKIFSWAATVFVAAIGGVIALAGKSEFQFTNGRRGAMIVALGVLAFYSCKWILANIGFEEDARTALLDELRASGLSESSVPDPQKNKLSGYVAALFSLPALRSLQCY